MPTLKQLWHDPVWSKVIAGSILAAIGVVVTYFLDWWSAIGHFLKATIDFFLASSSIPNWILSILILVFLAVVAVVATSIWERFNPKAKAATWDNYTCDTFFGIVWRWRYRYGAIKDLTTYCPTCDYQVFPKDFSSYQSSPRWIFQCESCGKQFAEIRQSTTELESKVERFIQQRIRKGIGLTPGA